MQDYIVLFSFIVGATIIISFCYDILDAIYWKYIDWKYKRKEKGEIERNEKG